MTVDRIATLLPGDASSLQYQLINTLIRTPLETGMHLIISIIGIPHIAIEPDV